MDIVTPPSTVFAAFNAYEGEKAKRRSTSGATTATRPAAPTTTSSPGDSSFGYSPTTTDRRRTRADSTCSDPVSRQEH
ncbi:hypothetical protein [Sinomonas humi]|uniref:hypothetical protein n=1 Tax=Sinomonas humi TaxID=1338436 RepID=UPI002F3E39EE